jgi:hypothetical protein
MKKIFGLMIYRMHQWKKLLRRKSKTKNSDVHGRKGNIPGRCMKTGETYRKFRRRYRKGDKEEE